MTSEDYRGLTPLIYAHVNPYSRFDLDLDSRIEFDKIAAGVVAQKSDLNRECCHI